MTDATNTNTNNNTNTNTNTKSFLRPRLRFQMNMNRKRSAEDALLLAGAGRTTGRSDHHEEEEDVQLLFSSGGGCNYNSTIGTPDRGGLSKLKSKAILYTCTPTPTTPGMSVTFGNLSIGSGSPMNKLNVPLSATKIAPMSVIKPRKMSAFSPFKKNAVDCHSISADGDTDRSRGGNGNGNYHLRNSHESDDSICADDADVKRMDMDNGTTTGSTSASSEESHFQYSFNSDNDDDTSSLNELRQYHKAGEDNDDDTSCLLSVPALTRMITSRSHSSSIVSDEKPRKFSLSLSHSNTCTARNVIGDVTPLTSNVQKNVLLNARVVTDNESSSSGQQQRQKQEMRQATAQRSLFMGKSLMCDFECELDLNGFAVDVPEDDALNSNTNNADTKKATSTSNGCEDYDFFLAIPRKVNVNVELDRWQDENSGSAKLIKRDHLTDQCRLKQYSDLASEAREYASNIKPSTSFAARNVATFGRSASVSSTFTFNSCNSLDEAGKKSSFVDISMLDQNQIKS